METNNYRENQAAKTAGEISVGAMSPRFALAANAAFPNSPVVGFNEVVRALISHREWIVPLEMLAREGDSKRRIETMMILGAERIAPADELWIFTDEEAALLGQAKNPSLGTYGGGMSGTELFCKIPPNVKIVYINPGSPEKSIWYFQRGGGIEGARLWARSVALEDQFAEWERTGAFDETAFAGFPFITLKLVAGGVMTLPYESLTVNRAAVFTAPDCTEKFLSQFTEKQRSQIEEVTVEGATMLRQLPEIGVDGIVVNVAGPGATLVHDFVKKPAILSNLKTDASASERKPEFKRETTMNLIKDAFALLYFLAGADGQVDKREMDIIVDFINRQHGQLNFDPHQTMSDLAALSSEARFEAYDRAVAAFKDHSSIEDRHTLMNFAADLAAADGAITGNEQILFQNMAEVFGIDLQTFFQQPKSVVAPAAGTAANGTDTNRACYQAWLLGSAYSTYLSKVPLLGSALCQADFDAAKVAADVMGLTIKPLEGLDVAGLPASFGEMMAGNFFTEESQRIVEQMNRQSGSDKVSSYFLIIAKCNLTLARLERAHEAEAVLNEILRLSVHTEIPDESIEELVLTVRHGVRDFSAFEDSVTKFLFARTAPPASPAPAAPPDDEAIRKTDQGNFFAWSLGSSLALYALAEAYLNPVLAAKHFEKAQTAALAMGLYINPLTGMTGDVRSNQILMLVYLLNQDGLRLANEMDAKYGTMVSAYFYIVIYAYNLLLMITPETYLDSILSLKPHTEIPDEFFLPITSAIRQAVKYEVLQPTVTEFDRSISKFLYNRMNGEKNSIEKNISQENNQPNDFKSAAQTAVTTPNPSETLSAPLQILSAYSQGRAGNDEVLRSLISHRGWFAPVEMFYREGEDVIDIEKGVSTDERHIKAGELWLFTDYESVIRAVDANAQIGAYGGTISGTELFGKIPADIKSISINPGSPREKTWSFFEQGSVELARLWSEVITLEEKIEQWQPDKPDLTALGNYRGFVTVVNAETNGIFLIKEFSEEMRIAAPVFTAPDSADKFLKNLPPEKSAALKQITINGHTLLNDLPNMKIEMPNNQPPRSFDGAIINAYGPGAFYIFRFGDIIRKT